MQPAVAAGALVDATGILRGMEVLDVATGTGDAALLAARRGARVIGVDHRPQLLALARETAVAEGLEVEFIEGDAEALEFEEDRFDRVLSLFGVIFAQRPAVAAGELARVCAPEGVIGLTTWPRDDLPAAAEAWGTEASLRELFAPRGVQVRVERRTEPPEDYLLVTGVKTG